MNNQFSSKIESLKEVIFSNANEINTSSRVEIINLLNDICEAQKKTETKLEQCESRLNTEHIFVKNINNKIISPLNGILGFTELLKETKLDEDQTESLRMIANATDDLLNLVHDITDYSKLTSGEIEFDNSPFDFFKVIRDVTYLMNTLIINKRVKLEVNIDPNIPEQLTGDSEKLRQMLINIIGNAIKFTEKGDIVLDIKIHKEHRKEVELIFEIIDSGIGISEEKLPYIFHPFGQNDRIDSNKKEGTGLGLTISKYIVDALGGQITVMSKLNFGTSFKITLPFTIAKNVPVNTVISSNAFIQTEQFHLDGIEVLVFEDNLLNQRLIEERLKKWGCKVYLAEDGNQGLNLLDRKKIDLILMDIRMPGMDGYEVSKIIRDHNDPYIKSIPIIALSADLSLKDKKMCELYGIHDFLTKPFSSKELLQKIVIHTKKSSKVNLRKVNGEISFGKSKPSEAIELKTLLEECNNDMDLLEEVLRLYKTNAREFIELGKEYIAQQNIKELKYLAHKIKPGLLLFRSQNLYKLLIKIEEICKRPNEHYNLKFLHNQFISEYYWVSDKLDEELALLQ